MHGFSVRCIRSARILVNGHCRAVSVVNRTAALGGFDSIVHSGKATTTQRWMSSSTGKTEGARAEAASGASRGRQGRKARGKARIWSKSDPTEDLCRIKWDPDPDEPPKGFIRGHIPDAIKCKMFELYSQDSDTNSVRVLAKRFGLRLIDVQSIITLKSRAKEHVDAGNGYELFPEIEVEMTRAKEEFIEELGLDYGMELPFLYEHATEIDHEDPSTWVDLNSNVIRKHKTVILKENDRDDKFDLPPGRTPEEVEEDLYARRSSKTAFRVERDAEAEKISGKLADKPKLPKKRWAYAMKDTTSEETKKLSPMLRDADGKLRVTKVEEEMTLSFANSELFGSLPRRRGNRIFKDID